MPEQTYCVCIYIYIYIFIYTIKIYLCQWTRYHFLSKVTSIFTHDYHHLLWWNKTYGWPSINSYIYFTRAMIARTIYLSWRQQPKHTQPIISAIEYLKLAFASICLSNIIHLSRGKNASRFKTSLFSNDSKNNIFVVKATTETHTAYYIRDRIP